VRKEVCGRWSATGPQWLWLGQSTSRIWRGVPAVPTARPVGRRAAASRHPAWTARHTEERAPVVAHYDGRHSRALRHFRDAGAINHVRNCSRRYALPPWMRRRAGACRRRRSTSCAVSAGWRPKRRLRKRLRSATCRLFHAPDPPAPKPPARSVGMAGRVREPRVAL